MTGEPVHTTSEAKMVQFLMLSTNYTPDQLSMNTVTITLHFQLCSAFYTVSEMKMSLWKK